MNTLIVLLIFSFSFNSFAQNESQPKDIFLRIYNAEGKKIAKGKLVQVTDSTLTLKRNKDNRELAYSDIETIKTRRSFGHKVGIGTAIGAGTMATIGAISNLDSSSNYISFSGGEGAIIGAIIGVPSGAFVGAVSSIFKKPEVFQINGSEDQWQAFKVLFSD